MYSNRQHSSSRKAQVFDWTTILTFLWPATVAWNLFTNMYRHLKDNHFICRQQHSFCKLRSCETQLIRTIHDFATMNNSDQAHAILLDLSKAFDTVPHGKLCHKLSSYGIRGQLLNWINALLTGRYQQGSMEKPVDHIQWHQKSHRGQSLTSYWHSPLASPQICAISYIITLRYKLVA